MTENAPPSRQDWRAVLESHHPNKPPKQPLTAIPPEHQTDEAQSKDDAVLKTRTRIPNALRPYASHINIGFTLLADTREIELALSPYYSNDQEHGAPSTWPRVMLHLSESSVAYLGLLRASDPFQTLPDQHFYIAALHHVACSPLAKFSNPDPGPTVDAYHSEPDSSETAPKHAFEKPRPPQSPPPTLPADLPFFTSTAPELYRPWFKTLNPSYRRPITAPFETRILFLNAPRTLLESHSDILEKLCREATSTKDQDALDLLLPTRKILQDIRAALSLQL